MAELRAEHLQKDHVILMHGHWVTIAKTPTMGRQFVIVTTEFGETGLRFGTLVEVQEGQGTMPRATDLTSAEYIELVSLAARLTSDAPASVPGTVCPGSGRKWGSGTGSPICPVCHRGPGSLGVQRPTRRLGRWTGVVPDHTRRGK